MYRLPKNAHRHDRDWIKGQLDQLAELTSYHAASLAAVKYDGVYEKVIEEKEYNEIELEGQARRQANLRLMRYVKAFENKYIKRSN